MMQFNLKGNQLFVKNDGIATNDEIVRQIENYVTRHISGKKVTLCLRFPLERNYVDNLVFSLRKSVDAILIRM